MREPESYGKVPYTRVKGAIKQIEEHYQDCPERLEEIEITFEYLVGSFFPKIIENIDLAMNRTYMAGYLQGKMDAERGEQVDVSQGDN